MEEPLTLTPEPETVAEQGTSVRRSAAPCSSSFGRVMTQAVASAEQRGIPQWVPADKWLPMGPHCVLATDLECHFIAVWDGTEWCNAWTDEAIDSVVTHWMELPDPPEDE